MKKLVPAALLVMALIAAPVLAQVPTAEDAPASSGENAELAPDTGTSSAAEPPLTEPVVSPPAPEPAPTELESTPATETQQNIPPVENPPPPQEDPPPQAPLPPAPTPQVSQEAAGDQQADGDDLEQDSGNQQSILGALRQAADGQEADGGEAEQVDEDSNDIAELRQRIEDRKDDISSLQQRNADRNDDGDGGPRRKDDDDDNGPGRKDRDKKEDRDGGIKQETDQEAESGDVDQSVDISNTGDYAQQCVAVLQAANTGNAQNAPAFLQYSGDADDFEPGGIEIDISPQIVQDCRQIIQQTTVVNQLLPGAGRSRAGQPATRRPGVAGAGIPPRVAGAGFTGAGSGGAFNVPTRLGQSAAGISGIGQARVQPLNAPSPGRMLPRTGGPGAVSLLTLGAGALLIAGGLLVRRISR